MLQKENWLALDERQPIADEEATRRQTRDSQSLAPILPTFRQSFNSLNPSVAHGVGQLTAGLRGVKRRLPWVHRAAAWGEPLERRGSVGATDRQSGGCEPVSSRRVRPWLRAHPPGMSLNQRQSAVLRSGALPWSRVYRSKDVAGERK
jgi:hypothetical protein